MNLKRRKQVFEDAIFERILEKKRNNTRTASEEKYVEDEGCHFKNDYHPERADRHTAAVVPQVNRSVRVLPEAGAGGLRIGLRAREQLDVRVDLASHIQSKCLHAHALSFDGGRWNERFGLYVYNG